MQKDTAHKLAADLLRTLVKDGLSKVADHTLERLIEKEGRFSKENHEFLLDAMKKVRDGAHVSIYVPEEYEMEPLDLKPW